MIRCQHNLCSTAYIQNPIFVKFDIIKICKYINMLHNDVFYIFARTRAETKHKCACF